MKIRSFFKISYCFGFVLSLVLYLFNLYGRYIEQTQNPITDYTYNGYLGNRHYKSSNQIYITYNSKQYTLHTGDRIYSMEKRT